MSSFGFAVLGQGQNHLAVAGGYAVGTVDAKVRCAAPTRYREVVLTVPNRGRTWITSAHPLCPTWAALG